MPVSVALSMLTPAALMKERPLPPHSRLFEVQRMFVFNILFLLQFVRLHKSNDQRAFCYYLLKFDSQSTAPG